MIGELATLRKDTQCRVPLLQKFDPDANILFSVRHDQYIYPDKIVIVIKLLRDAADDSYSYVVSLDGVGWILNDLISVIGE